MEDKTCTRCKETKPLSDFYIRPDRPCGYSSHCRVCDGKKCKQYQENNLYKFRLYGAKHRAANTEKVRQARALYRAENRDTLRAKNREYARTHPDICNAKWHRRNSALLNTGKSFTAQEWFALKQTCVFTCLCCGRQEPEIKLTADHVIPISKGGHNTIDNIQPLCRSCNSAKHTKATDYRVDNRMQVAA